MSVNVQPRCFILSLFIRDDGERLLLGSGAYEFQEKQQHFVANAMVSDTVDVQGTDGTLLAGQVRRASSQSFDGYVGDATSTKAEIEQYRREFIEYFAKNHFYSVVYVFSDGTAIKRQRGFVVDAPEVKELFQIHPEYHVALNFEDVNYYEYNEDEAGQELYSQMFKIARTDSQQGGLMWDSYGAIMLPFDATQKTVSGTTISIDDALSAAPIDIQIQGDTEQDGTPTPTTPVPIETVTGLQTVTISDGGSSQRTVEVNLGNIELCKIGDYQDYIYQDSGKWYLHKEIGNATFDGTEGWSASSSSSQNSYYRIPRTNAKLSHLNLYTGMRPILITTFTVGTTSSVLANIGYAYVGTDLNLNYNGTKDQLATFTSWLANGLTSVYAPLKVATDTEITNTEVLAGLNQLGSGSLYAGTNNIVVTSEDLPGTLQLTYSRSGGDDPGGFEWEAGGGGGLVSVTVDSIADVYPLITINGPATNPTLENLTTSTTMSYVGTIAEGQSLVIDTMAQTAKVSGTNVVQNLYGDWLFLSPGVNRIAYTTGNSDAPDAEGEFNEIVG